MRLALFFAILMCLSACKATKTNAPLPVEQLRNPSMHWVDVTFRDEEALRRAAYTYNHLRFELGQELGQEPPRHLVGLWCTDAELPGFIIKLRQDPLLIKVESAPK